MEFMNPHNRIIVLTGPHKEIVQFKKFEKKSLPDWYRKYVPKYLRVVDGDIKKKIELDNERIKQRNDIRRKNKAATVIINNKKRLERLQAKRSMSRSGVAAQIQNKNKLIHRDPKTNMVLGRNVMSSNKSTEYYRDLIAKTTYPISDEIGVGILSYNRLGSLKRLVDSIRKFTNFKKTTVFISDESTDNKVKEYIRNINDMVVIDNSKRLGIAGNTNRLFNCLSRFKYGIILNDDVEVLRVGWENFYPNIMGATNIHHFCMRQSGVYGAKVDDGVCHKINGMRINTIQDKPQGAVMAFTNEAFCKVGYFDEQFGLYGMEHVDWSTRVSRSGIQQPGFHDASGSHIFFKVYSEKSAVENRGGHLARARKTLNQLKANNRIFVKATSDCDVDGVSFIVPFQGKDRDKAIKTVFRNIKAQLYPKIEIVMVEQDNVQHYKNKDFPCAKYLFVKPAGSNFPFIKSLAFNVGVNASTCNKLVLHDADILASNNYTLKVVSKLKRHDGVHIGKNVLYLSKKSSDRAIKSLELMDDYSCDRVVGYFEGGSLACNKQTYVSLGGFDERFIGYGCEDTEFYKRLSSIKAFCGDRKEDFIHIHHGRNRGWNEYHEKNKALEIKIYSSPMDKRMKRLNEELTRKY